MNEHKVLAISLVFSTVILVAGIYATTLYWKSKETEIKKVELLTQKQEIKRPNKKDYLVGNFDKGDLFLISYIDPECIGCKNFYKLEKKLIDKYKNQESVAFIYRLFPLYRDLSGNDGLHPSAGLESRAIDCVVKISKNKNKFFDYLESIFRETKSDGKFSKIQLENLAINLGIDKDKFNQCLNDEENLKDFENNWIYNYKAGVRSVPKIYIYIKSNDAFMEVEPNIVMIEEIINKFLESQEK